jgi:hypothetical protein
MKEEKMLKTANDVQVGDVVLHQAFDGSRRMVSIIYVSKDIKNGKSGFDGFLVENPNEFVWGYCEQIVCFVSHAKENN